jgi:uncharacterized HAD superfamily protein
LRVGVDLDGTITRKTFLNPQIWLPQLLFFVLIPHFLTVTPNETIVNMLKGMTDNRTKVVIVSARPPWAAKMTRWWLKKHQVPFSKLICVGFGKGTAQRKLEVIRKKNLKLFFDDEKRTVDFLTHNLVRAILVHAH